MLRSLPALKQALLQIESVERAGSVAAAFEAADLVCAYRVANGVPIEQEARAVASAVITLADRLARLESAYAYWQPFEPGPYFDLRPEQAALMCEVEESAGFVRVRLYADLLVPSFRAAERLYSQEFLPAMQVGAMASRIAHIAEARQAVQALWPLLQARLRRAEEVIRLATTLLLQTGDVSFLAAWGAAEERRRVGKTRAAHAPTLTLDYQFPRPLSRRASRQRILRRRLLRRRQAGWALVRRSGRERWPWRRLRRPLPSDEAENWDWP